VYMGLDRGGRLNEHCHRGSGLNDKEMGWVCVMYVIYMD